MTDASATSFAVVVPTVGRPSLGRLLGALARELDGRQVPVILVDDRRRAAGPLLPDAPAVAVDVLRSGGRGPAAARNAGLRRARAPWVVFLDDDVVPEPGWGALLVADLHGAADDAAGVQGHIVVPRPAHRPATDWERNVTGLEHARWATADLAYRRDVLLAVGGFDERFPRAYREDADLGLRVTDAGWRITTGHRVVRHPVGHAPWYVSVVKQLGNVDDALMRRLHGRDWHARAGAPAGRRPRHVVTSLAGAVALAGTLGRRPAPALAGTAAWVAGTVELALARIRPGPRHRYEVATMLVTSALIPPVATAAAMFGAVRATALTRTAARPIRRFDAVLLDRDGTLVCDVPYNGDPSRVQPVPGARDALDRARSAGLRVALVTNQSGIGRGLLDHASVDAVNARIAALLGPFDAVLVCPHGPGDACTCRKPEPGLLLRAAAAVGTTPSRCAMVGDIGADVEAARRAGAWPVLVPTATTRPEEIAAAPLVARDLAEAVSAIIEEGRR